MYAYSLSTYTCVYLHSTVSYRFQQAALRHTIDPHTHTHTHSYIHTYIYTYIHTHTHSEAGFLEAEGMEKTYRFQQAALREAVDVGSAKKIFTLRLDDLGPYNAQYSRNGRHLLIGGKMGHLAVCDWVDGRVRCEVQVRGLRICFVCMCVRVSCENATFVCIVCVCVLCK